MEKELSKEEILRKHCGKLPLSDHSGMRELQTDLSNVEDAMDEFADQEKKKEAIAFAQWCSDENYIYISNGKWVHVYKRERKTTEELYNLYSQVK